MTKRKPKTESKVKNDVSIPNNETTSAKKQQPNVKSPKKDNGQFATTSATNKKQSTNSVKKSKQNANNKKQLASSKSNAGPKNTARSLTVVNKAKNRKSNVNKSKLKKVSAKNGPVKKPSPKVTKTSGKGRVNTSARSKSSQNKSSQSAKSRSPTSPRTQRKTATRKPISDLDPSCFGPGVSARVAKENFQKKLSTINGQFDLIRMAQKNEEFARNLVGSLNEHVDKIVDKVRIKRKPKKMSRAAKLNDIKNKKLDLNSPESILTTVNLSNLINKRNFLKLPAYYQYRLTKLLPNCDQHVDDNNVVSPASSFFNEYTSNAISSFSNRLREGRLTTEAQNKLKREMEKAKNRLDPLKVKYFEQHFSIPDREIKPKQTEEERFQEGFSFMKGFYNCYKTLSKMKQSLFFTKTNDPVYKTHEDKIKRVIKYYHDCYATVKTPNHDQTNNSSTKTEYKLKPKCAKNLVSKSKPVDKNEAAKLTTTIEIVKDRPVVKDKDTVTIMVPCKRKKGEVEVYKDFLPSLLVKKRTKKVNKQKQRNIFRLSKEISQSSSGLKSNVVKKSLAEQSFQKKSLNEINSEWNSVYDKKSEINDINYPYKPTVRFNGNTDVHFFKTIEPETITIDDEKEESINNEKNNSPIMVEQLDVLDQIDFDQLLQLETPGSEPFDHMRLFKDLMNEATPDTYIDFGTSFVENNQTLPIKTDEPIIIDISDDDPVIKPQPPEPQHQSQQPEPQHQSQQPEPQHQPQQPKPQHQPQQPEPQHQPQPPESQHQPQPPESQHQPQPQPPEPQHQPQQQQLKTKMFAGTQVIVNDQPKVQDLTEKTTYVPIQVVFDNNQCPQIQIQQDNSIPIGHIQQTVLNNCPIPPKKRRRISNPKRPAKKTDKGNFAMLNNQQSTHDVSKSGPFPQNSSSFSIVSPPPSTFSSSSKILSANEIVSKNPVNTQPTKKQFHVLCQGEMPPQFVENLPVPNSNSSYIFSGGHYYQLEPSTSQQTVAINEKSKKSTARQNSKTKRTPKRPTKTQDKRQKCNLNATQESCAKINVHVPTLNLTNNISSGIQSLQVPTTLRYAPKIKASKQFIQNPQTLTTSAQFVQHQQTSPKMMSMINQGLKINQNQSLPISSRFVQNPQSTATILNQGTNQTLATLTQFVQKPQSSATMIVNEGTNQTLATLTQFVQKPQSSTTTILNQGTNQTLDTSTQFVQKPQSSTTTILNQGTNQTLDTSTQFVQNPQITMITPRIIQNQEGTMTSTRFVQSQPIMITPQIQNQQGTRTSIQFVHNPQITMTTPQIIENKPESMSSTQFEEIPPISTTIDMLNQELYLPPFLDSNHDHDYMVYQSILSDDNYIV